MTGALTGRRGCGTSRTKGGLYVECGTSPFGEDITFFLADPPIPYTPQLKVGMTLVERDGTYHLIDWVGETFYPYAADIIMETARMGLSRRAPQYLDYSRLSPASRIILVHAKGRVKDFETNKTYQEAVQKAERQSTGSPLSRWCRLYHNNNDDFHLRKLDASCSRHHWVFAPPNTITGRERLIADTRYRVYNVGVEADFEPAIIASFPIGRFALVKGGNDYLTKKERFEKTITLPFVEVDE